MILEYTIRECRNERDALDRFEGVLWCRGLILKSGPTVMWQPTLFTDLPDAIVQAKVTKEK